MCLITQNKEGKASNKPIVCYKVYQNNAHGQMISPVMRERYRLKEGDEVVAKEDPAINIGTSILDCDRVKFKEYYLGQGFIHAVRNKERILLYDTNVWRAIGLINRCIKEGNVIWRLTTDSALERVLAELSALSLCEMEIPAGEKYWIGGNGDICAHRMILKKKFKITKKSEVLELMSLLGVCDCQESVDAYKEQENTEE